MGHLVGSRSGVGVVGVYPLATHEPRDVLGVAGDVGSTTGVDADQVAGDPDLPDVVEGKHVAGVGPWIAVKGATHTPSPLHPSLYDGGSFGWGCLPQPSHSPD